MGMLLDRRYNPFRDFADINSAFFGDNSLAEFKTDIRDLGDNFQMECDLPGFKKEDIKLNLNGGTLTIQAERHSNFEDQDKKSGYVRCERSYGAYSRSFDVTGVDTAHIHASYDGGVLTVTLPKQAPRTPEGQQIAIE
jgi:HSP20 family protein